MASIIELLGADRLDDRVSAEPIGEFLDRRYTGIASFGDDVSGAELDRELLPRLVPAHRDDSVGAELLGDQHGEQADGTVTDHGDGLARASLPAPVSQRSRKRHDQG